MAESEITRRWWANRRTDFDLFASTLVVDEASDGDAALASVRAEGEEYDGYAEHLRQIEEGLKDRLVDRSPRAPVKTKGKAS